MHGGPSATTIRRAKVPTVEEQRQKNRQLAPGHDLLIEALADLAVQDLAKVESPAQERKVENSEESTTSDKPARSGKA
jgi:hypothetical protein